MTKATVFYDATKTVAVQRGFRAIVHPLTHKLPLVSNTQAVITSTVQRVERAGPWSGSEVLEFETENSVYKPLVPGDDQ